MYNTKYNIQYQDINNTQTTINIKQKDYQGEIIELEKYGVDPLIVKWFGEGGSKFQTIQQSEARISLLSEFNFEFLEFSDFEEKEYLVEILKGGQIYWIGYLLPDNYKESYVAPPYEIELLAIDYLTTLKDIDFNDSQGDNIYEIKSLLEVLIIIFDKIGLDLQIFDGIDVKYSDSVVSTLSETKINCKKYINGLNGDNPTPWNCQDVLEEILQGFGATLKQNQGRWEISHFDNQSKDFQKFSYTGLFLGSGSTESIKYLDDFELKIVDESGDLEIEGGKKSIEITQKIGDREDVIEGSNFKLSSSWVNSNDLQNWSENNISLDQKEDGLYINDKFDNLNQVDPPSTYQETTKNYYIKSDPVPVSRLPITLDANKNDKWLDLDYLIRVEPEFTAPSGLTSNPDYDREQYYTYLDSQLEDFINGLNFGSYFAVKYTDSTGTYFLNFWPHLTNKDDLSVAVCRNWKSEWFEQGTIIWNNYLNANRVDFKQVEVSTNRNIYNQIVGANKEDFLNKFYNYQHRIYLYEDRFDQQIPLIQEDGQFEFYFTVPWFKDAVASFGSVPEEYRITFTGIGVTFERISIGNQIEEKEDKIYVGDNQKNFKKLDGFELSLGDGDILNFSSLMKNDGITPTSTWKKDGVELPILQHSANRIIKQYQNPSMVFRASIFTDTVIDMNSVLYNPMTDKYFVIIGLELDDKEAVYNCELRELLEDVAENDQLIFIKNMTYTFTDDEEGYSITLNE